MMKSSFATVLLLGVLALLIVTMDISETRVLVRHGNTQKEPLEIVLEKYICIESRVPIVELFNSAQAILPSGDTYFFNDVGNVFLWLERVGVRPRYRALCFSQRCLVLARRNYPNGVRFWSLRIPPLRKSRLLLQRSTALCTSG